HTRSKRDWSSDVCSSDLTHANGCTFMRQQDGVGLYRAYCAPSEFQLRELFLGCSFAGSQSPSRSLIALSLVNVCFLQQTATRDFFDLYCWYFMLSNKDANILLALQNLDGSIFVGRCDDDLGEDVSNLGCHFLGDF